MSLKDVSFWCIVLAIVSAMTIQHILSINTIEGNVDGPINIDLVIVTEGGEEGEEGKSTKDLERQNKILTDENIKLSNKNKELKEELISSEKRESEIAASAEIIEEEPSETPEPTPESTPEPTPPPRIELTPDDYNEHYYEINTCGKEGKDPPMPPAASII